MTLRRPLCLCLLLGAGALSAQAGAPAPAPGDTVVVRPIGGRYAGGWLRRLLLGSDYRALWALPVSIPVLDLAGYGGGLTPVSRGGGQQTTSLRLRAADGREFYFRSIDKDPSPNLPPELLGTVVAGVVQDQVSSALPTAPLVVAPLLEAAGVPHGTPELYTLPDDPKLGEHRAALAGLIGMLEPRIAAGWAGAAEVISGEDLFTRIERSPDDRVDVQALLTARLVDILVGDWDRHRDQWSWMRGDGPGPRRWIPVPRDRDFAMVSYDGLLLAIARMELPQLITFRPDYPGTLGLTWNGRELDRVFLTELEWPASGPGATTCPGPRPASTACSPPRPRCTPPTRTRWPRCSPTGPTAWRSPSAAATRPARHRTSCGGTGVAKLGNCASSSAAGETAWWCAGHATTASGCG